MKLKLGLPLACLLLPVSGCTWVDLKPEAELVVVITPEIAETCRPQGTIVSSTRSQVGFYHRTSETLKAELETLARNQATTMDANAILPVGEVSEKGEQKFKAFRCSNR